MIHACEGSLRGNPEHRGNPCLKMSMGLLAGCVLSIWGVRSLHGCKKKQHKHAESLGHVMALRVLKRHCMLQHAAYLQTDMDRVHGFEIGIPEVVHWPHCTLYVACLQVYSILHTNAHSLSADV